MFFSFFAAYMFLSVIDGADILEKAHDVGFYYRSVSFIKVEECKGKDLCFESNGKNYVLRKKDKVEIVSEIKERKLEINIVPDDSYISYFLYIEHKAGVYKIQMTNRNIVIDQGVANIVRIQIVGTGTKGPVPLYTRTFRKTETPIAFSGNFDESLKKLRQRYSLPLLKNDPSLEVPAKKALERVSKSGLVHYSSESGGPGHTGIRKNVIGENLFNAVTIEKAWEMMVKSPSHLYNFLNPSHRSYYFATIKEGGFISGAVLFSN